MGRPWIGRPRRLDRHPRHAEQARGVIGEKALYDVESATVARCMRRQSVTERGDL